MKSHGSKDVKLKVDNELDIESLYSDGSVFDSSDSESSDDEVLKKLTYFGLVRAVLSFSSWTAEIRDRNGNFFICHRDNF
ncbi:hypothetical protein AAHC03_0255 [Spirometra sp. Aus1]